MKRLRKWLGSISFALFVICMCITIIGSAQGRKPSFFGYEFLRVLTGSMEPVIDKDSCIIIKKANPEDIKEGDIITFISEEEEIYGMYNTHRVVEIGEDNEGDRYFVTKGDNNPDNDTKHVPAANLVGTYVKKMPLGDLIGNIAAALTDSKMYFGIVLLPLLLCLLSYVYDIYKIITEDDDIDLLDVPIEDNKLDSNRLEDNRLEEVNKSE